MSEPAHYIQSVYSMLARLGVDPHSIEVNYSVEKTEATLAIAIPDSKIGIALEGDNIDGLDKAGWYVKKLTVGEMETFGRVYQALTVSAFEHVRRKSSKGMVKTGSKEEERLLKAILNANLPNPNRNYRVNRENGSELTTPDFVWEDLKIAFFMDGLWWHVGLDDKEKVKMLNELAQDSEKSEVAMETNRVRATKDADNRSELASMGWVILSCTDEDLVSDEGVTKQVERIVRTMRQRKQEMSGRNQIVKPKAKADEVKELLEMI